jgi:polysaccharide deacetylase 2 family uncharacterized protein YibQ
VAADDLNTPLGQDKRKPKRKLPIGGAQVLAGLLSLFALAVVGWTMLVSDPLGGEPMAVVATPPMQTAKATQAADGDGRHHDRYDGPGGAAAKPAEPPAGATTITIIDGSSGKHQQVVVPDRSAAAAKKTVAAADPRLLESTPQGAIPKVAPDGTQPLTRYAQTREVPANRSGAPRIAIVVGGLGISATATGDALARLPAAVTLAFAPYGAGLEQEAGQARAGRHEILLQVPMEPFDYPNNEPGPHTLLTTLGAPQNIDRLHWLMARFQGYVGVASYMGAKFTASEQALSPVLREVAKRGLIYVDDGSSARSVASQLAGGYSVPFAKADIVLDAVPTPVAIEQALVRLEMLARDPGTAVGFASAQPAAISAIAEWASKVEDRGILLVPITMVALKAKSS